MPVALLFIGFIAFMSGVKGTYKELGKQLAADFTGAGNFWYFIAGVVVLGAIGATPALRQTSRMLIALVILVFALSNRGLWSNLTKALAEVQSSGGIRSVDAPVAVSVGAADPNAVSTGTASADDKAPADATGGGAASAGDVAGAMVSPMTYPLLLEWFKNFGASALTGGK